MIQILKMNKCWTLAFFVLFLLMPLLSSAEGNDPFDNTILTFEDNVGSSEPLVGSVESTANQKSTTQSSTPAAINKPVNERYQINRYLLQGLIKSENKTQMIFLALDENIKFFLGMNDCLGVECAYVTYIDKRGRVTYEDDFGIYRFQVGQGPYTVKQKGLIATENAMFPGEMSQLMTDILCENEDPAISNIEGMPKDTCQCVFFNFWASLTIKDMEEYTLEVEETLKTAGIVGEEISEQELKKIHRQAIGMDSFEPGELPDITEAQAIRASRGASMAFLNNKNFQEASLYCQETLGIAENEVTSSLLGETFIKASSTTIFPNLERVESSNEEIDEALKDEITSESELPLDDIVNLENSLQEVETENLSLRSEIEALSNFNIALSEDVVSLNEQVKELTTSSQNLQGTADSDLVQELQNTIATLEQALDQKEENINLLQEELQNSTVKPETTASSDDDAQGLQGTIAALQSELDNKNIALNDAENKIAVQEKQIDNLKNNLDSMLSESGAPDSNIIQELQDTIAAQEQDLDQKEENINLLQEELQNWVNSSTSADVATSSDDAQGLQGTIAALQSELDNKSNIGNQSKALNDAESKIAVQEKQISTLKSDLDAVFVDFNEKLNAKQQLINDLNSQLLLAESTETTPDANDIKGDNLMVAREDVKIKEEPSPNSSSIGMLLKDSTVKVESTEQGWHKIILKGGKEGYIYSPLDNKSNIGNQSKALNDAESKIAVQEKQISTLKSDLDAVFVDFNEKLNAKQQLINDLNSQLLLVESTSDPSPAQQLNEQSADSAATQSTAEPMLAQEENAQSADSAATQSTETTSDANDIKGDNPMVAREDVNVREKPSPNSTILGVLLKDSMVNVEDTVEGWHKIITKGGEEGYIYSPMLKKIN